METKNSMKIDGVTYTINVQLHTWIEFINHANGNVNNYPIKNITEWVTMYVSPWQQLMNNLYKDLKFFQKDTKTWFKSTLEYLELSTNNDLLDNWWDVNKLESLNKLLSIHIPRIAAEYQEIVKKNFIYTDKKGNTHTIDNDELLNAVYQLYNKYYNISKCVAYYQLDFMQKEFYKIKDLSEDFTKMIMCTPYYSPHDTYLFSSYDFFDGCVCNPAWSDYFINPAYNCGSNEVAITTELDNIIMNIFYKPIYKNFEALSKEWVNETDELTKSYENRCWLNRHYIYDNENYIQFVPLSADNLPWGFVIKDTDL